MKNIQHAINAHAFATKLTREISAGKRNPERDYTNKRAKDGCPDDMRKGTRGVAK